MAYLLVVVLDDVKRLPELLAAWQAIGVPGVTILESTGGYRAGSWLREVGLGAIDQLLEAREMQRRTLLSAIEDESLLEQAVAEAERVVGGFDQPDTGILLVLPVARARGLKKTKPKAAEALAPLAHSEWASLRLTTIEKVAEDLKREPIVVALSTTLDEVARLMFTRPEVQVAGVIDEHGQLKGLLDLAQVADHVFLQLWPEEFLTDIQDLEDVVKFADRSRVRTAGDAMQEAHWVQPEETIEAALRRMHRAGLTGLPVVDHQYHVTGYVSLADLLGLILGVRGGSSRTVPGADQ